MQDDAVIQEKSLQGRWDDLKAENPKLRIRDAATQLDVSEVELLTLSDEETVIRLQDNFGDINKEFPTLGRIMTLTRNEACVNERKGTYNSVKVMGGAMGLVVGPEIDLRIILSAWKHGYAVINKDPKAKYKKSFQFFDAHGDAIQKIFVEDEGTEAFEALVAKFKHDTQREELHIEKTPEEKTETPDSEIDIEGFTKEWDALEDTHDFMKLTKKYGVSRLQAVRIAGEERAYQVELSSVCKMLQAASIDQCPIMVFTGNRGNIQIHTGTVNNIKVMGHWVNVLDPDFNLHLREDMITSAWVVKKPTKDGVVTSLEIYDSKNNQISTFFGKRKPGIPELPEWQKIIEELPKAS